MTSWRWLLVAVLLSASMWVRYGVTLAIATAVIGIAIGLARVRYDEWRARPEA